MAKNIGTLVTAAIRPNDSLDPIASAYSSEIKGGLHSVDSLVDRDAIIIERRDWGMLCYVIDEDITYQLKYNYSSTDITDNTNWVEFTGSGIDRESEWIDSVFSIITDSPLINSDGDRYLAGTKPSDTLSGDWITYSAGVVFEWETDNWLVTYPTNGMSVRVDDEDNSIYRYEGDFPTGKWNKELLGQVRTLNVFSLDGGISYSGTTEPEFLTYVRDMVFLTKFDTQNVGASTTVNINGLGSKLVKKLTNNGLEPLVESDILSDLIYTLIYDEDNDCFQLIKHYSESFGIKYFIEETDYIVVPDYYQYWVYGDLTVEGTLMNYGQVVIAEGDLIISGSGSVYDEENIIFVDFPSPTASNIFFSNTETIEFFTEETEFGLSASAQIIDQSILPTKLNTSNYGGATAGYILSSSEDGYFEWVKKYSLTVVDGTIGQGVTVSDVNNMVFIGNPVKVPILGTSPSQTGDAIGVQVLPGLEPMYPPGTALIYIPKIPAPEYSDYFNEEGALVLRDLDTANVRISTPDLELDPFSIGDWINEPTEAMFSATIMATASFSTDIEVTGFSSDSNGDSYFRIEFLDGDGETVLYQWETDTIYSNGIFSDYSGSDLLAQVVITNYTEDDSGVEVWPSKWKAIPEISVNAENIFNSIGRDGGRYQVRITHHIDTSNNYDNHPIELTYISSEVFFDTNDTTPSIGGTTSIVEYDPVNIITKYISGVQYYTTGSIFQVETTDILNVNDNTQGFSQSIVYNFRIKSEGYGLPGIESGGFTSSGEPNGDLTLRTWDPLYGTFTGWSNQHDLASIDYIRSDWEITSTTYRYRGVGGKAESQVYDPWGESIINSSPTSSILIDCVEDESTDLVEYFDGESKRLRRVYDELSGGYTYIEWDSTVELSTVTSSVTISTRTKNDALVMGGSLVRADKFTLTDPDGTIQKDLTDFKPSKTENNPDYTSLYEESIYHRRFYIDNDNAISSFSMTVEGYFGSSVNLEEALENEQLKIYVQKVNSASPLHQSGPNSAPLSLHGGLYNFVYFNDGINPQTGNFAVDTYYSFIRTGVVADYTILGTFGSFDALNGFWIEIELYDPDIRLDTITVNFNQ